MGIPSYFSYIVKNHRNILRKQIPVVHDFYLDCNSIIYDGIHHFGKKCPSNTDIIQYTIAKIESYVDIIKPTGIVFIAFDGVAPVAKMEQQRERRFKSWFQNQYSMEPLIWNTTQITPGTPFMEQLNVEVDAYFQKKNDNTYVISTSELPGEGEHKIFEHIRGTSPKDPQINTVVYGLDADLIMLTLNHLNYCPHLYIFRETPEFIRYIDPLLEPNTNYMLDINLLAQSIVMEMNEVSYTDETRIDLQKHMNRIYDYILLCFFLGNDFMPHFPAANIRTNGLSKLLHAYNTTVMRADLYLTYANGTRIHWDYLRIFLDTLALSERTFIKKELSLRDRAQSNLLARTYPILTKQQRLDNTPLLDRELERFIDPYDEGWEARYYVALFQPGARIDDICCTYCQGLEWNLKYYSQGCADWKWSYPYSYPPLFEDLQRYIRDSISPTAELIRVSNENRPVSCYTQLCYVLPRESLHFLPPQLEHKMKSQYLHLYPLDCEFRWAFCKYFWEAHVEFPPIDIDQLVDIVTLCAEQQIQQPDPETL